MFTCKSACKSPILQLPGPHFVFFLNIGLGLMKIGVWFIMKHTVGLCSCRAWWLLAPNFCSWVTRESKIFHTNHMLCTLDFTVSEDWALFNFPHSTALYTILYLAQSSTVSMKTVNTKKHLVKATFFNSIFLFCLQVGMMITQKLLSLQQPPHQSGHVD